MDDTEGRARRYVCVTARTDEGGHVRPLSIQWHDGTTYPIDEVSSVERLPKGRFACKAVRYTIRIGASVTGLYLEGGRWHVLERRPGATP